jgi:hypothetical protein
MRRKRIVTFDDYLYRRCSTLHELGGSVDQLLVRGARTGDDIVILDAVVRFPDRLELKVFEVIERTTDGRAHRLKYSYQCRWRDHLLLRYDREPIRHPEAPEHRHLAGGGREPCGRVGLLDVVDEMWQEVERRKTTVQTPPGSADADVA